MAMRDLKTTMTGHCLPMLDYQDHHLISHGNTRNNTDVFPLKKLFFRGLSGASVAGLFFSKCHFAVTVFLVLLLASQPLWAEVRASLSRQSVYEGDTVSLNIVTNEAGQGMEPDLSVLRQDFDIVGTSTSQQTSIINGRHSSTHQWAIELSPKHGGELTVPSIRVGKDETASLKLTVTPQPDAVVAEAGQPVFVRAQLEPLDSPVRVQQQLRYTLQLFYRERLFEGNLDGPQVEHALVERLGDDLQYQTTMNGMEYQVLERHIAIFPEQSGVLSISPVIFSGRLAGRSQQPRMPSMFMDDMMERFFNNSTLATPGKPVRLRTEGFTIEVQPRATAFTGAHWLPSEQLTLTDSWATGPPEFRSGEPVTRTLTLEAKGLESTHLPEFNLPDSAAMRLYPEQPQLSNRTDGEWVIGTRQLTVAYVPSTTGVQTIPAITIDWWDTTENKQKTAELPAWTINVQPGSGVSNPSPPPRITPETAATEPAVDAAVEPEAGTAVTGWLADLKARWPWLVAALLLLVVTVFVLWRRKASREVLKAAPVAAKPATQPPKAVRNDLQKACQENDPTAAAKALLQWAAARWPEDPPRNLGTLRQRLSSGGREIQALEKALYGADRTAWLGDALWQVFDQGLEVHEEKQPPHGDGLSPLYPDLKT